MRHSQVVSMFVALFLIIGGVSGGEVFAAKKSKGVMTAVEVLKDIQKKEIGDSIESLHLRARSNGTYYYQVTVMDDVKDEYKDVLVDAQTGQILQVTEHSDEMPDGEMAR